MEIIGEENSERLLLPRVTSLLSLEDVGQHGTRSRELTHLAQELGLGVLAHQTGGYGHGATHKKQKQRVTKHRRAKTKCAAKLKSL